MLSFEQLEDLYSKYYLELEITLQAFIEHLKGQLSLFASPITYKGRVKELNSLYSKLCQKGNYNNKAIMPVSSDLLAVRLIVPFSGEALLLEEFIEKRYQTLEVERKAMNLTFKEFGYDSTHLLIKLPEEYQIIDFTDLCIEIQIRTILQDAWAEVEHQLVYSDSYAPQDQNLRRKMAAINASLTLADIIFQETRNEQKEVKNQSNLRQSRLDAHIEELFTVNFEVLPNNLSAGNYLLLGLKAHNAGHYQAAINFYSKLLNDKNISAKTSGLVLSHRAAAYLSCNKIEEACADYQAAVNIEAGAENFYYLAICLLLKQNYQKAVDNFNHSINLKISAHSYLGRARAYYQLNDHLNALADCERALALEKLPGAQSLKELLTT